MEKISARCDEEDGSLIDKTIMIDSDRSETR